MSKKDDESYKKNENVSPSNVSGMGSVTLPESPGSIENFSKAGKGSGDCPIVKKRKNLRKNLKKKLNKKNKFKFIDDLNKFLNK